MSMRQAPEDKRPPSDPLGEASREELEACVRLLAASLADHRERFGVVPLETVSQRLLAAGGAAQRTPLAEPAHAAIAEALTMVRVHLPAPGAAPPAPARSDHTEQRRQCRININAATTVLSADGRTRAAATLCNISWGGAAVRCTRMPGVPGERVRLLLPVGGGESIPVLATILRRDDGGGTTEYGLRFDSLSPRDEPRFRRVLEILLSQADGDGRRAEPRLVQRLDIEYGDEGELQATLEDISSGGLMLTVPEPLALHQSLLIALGSADGAHSLELRARVVHQTCVPGADFDMYRVGLEFEHPDAALKEQTAALIRQLALARPATEAPA